MDLRKHSAYGGKKWPALLREPALPLERSRNPVWNNAALNSEYGKLREVVLRMPGEELMRMSDPDQALFLSKPDLEALQAELRAVAGIFAGQGIVVHWLEEAAPYPNLLYLRDLFLVTPGPVLVARPASTVRAGEEVLAAGWLASQRLPQHDIVSGTFEASDLLFISPERLIFGCGNRSQALVKEELESALQGCGISIAGVYQLPPCTQHLLGVMNIVDRDLVLARRAAGPALVEMLNQTFASVVWLEECREVVELQAMNVVTLSPRRILMPDDCPDTKKLYEEAGLEVLTARISEIRKGAGGLACLTGIVKRDLV